jgi:hypothetical protein
MQDWRATDCACGEQAALLRLALALTLLRCTHVELPEEVRAELRTQLDHATEEVGELVTRL